MTPFYDAYMPPDIKELICHQSRIIYIEAWTKNAPNGRRHLSTYFLHYTDGIMGAIASQITCVTIVCSTACSGPEQIFFSWRKYQSSTSVAFVRGIHRWPVDSPHKGPVKRKTLPFDDVIMRGNNANFICDCLLEIDWQCVGVGSGKDLAQTDDMSLSKFKMWKNADGSAG